MKQKYTISIADVEINVIADGSQEQVEYVVGVIDRKMRDILLKSRQCPKLQAALLCALDFCNDKIEAKAEIEDLKTQLSEISESLKAEQERADRAERANIALEKAKARLEIENAKLRTDAPDMAEESVSDVSTEIENDISYATDEVETETTPKKKDSRSRVGSMFDLLTFSDI